MLARYEMRLVALGAVSAAVLAAPLWAASAAGTQIPGGTDTIPQTTFSIDMQLVGAQPEVITGMGPTVVQRGALKNGIIQTEILSLDLAGQSAALKAPVKMRAGREFGGKPVTGMIENVIVDAKGNFVGGDSTFTFVQLFFSVFGRQEFHFTYDVDPPLVVEARITSLPPNTPAKLPPLGPLNHYKCYSVKERKGFKPQSVSLGDQFQSATAKLVRPLTLCTPVSKNAEKVRFPQAHLKCYGISARSAKPKKGEVAVTVTNQFGTQKLTVLGLRTLCAPTLKKRVKVLPAKLVPPAGAPDALSDHFTCYDVRPKDAFAGRTVSLSDQFEVERAKVLKPVSLCAPVQKNALKIRDSATHLTCYSIRDVTRTLRPGGRLVVVRNQFGVEALEVGGPQTLCVPSQKKPPCSDYAERSIAQLKQGGQVVGTINDARHTPFKGVKDSPCE